MTIPVEQTRYVYVGPFSAGSVLPIPFSYDEPEHVRVISGSNKLEVNVDYSVLGKNVTMLTPVGTGIKVVVFRDTPLDNDAEFPQEAKFDSEKINDVIDKLTMQNQEQEDSLLRAIKLPMETDSSVSSEIIFPLPNPGKGIKWNNDGNLANTETNIDELLEKATAQADRAENKANVAEEQANIATEAARAAEQTLSDVHDAVADGLTQLSNKTDESITAIEDAATAATDTAIGNIVAASDETIATAKSWAVGAIEERPEGSSKYWAEVAKETVQFDTYTKSELDGKLAGKEPAITGTTGLTNNRVVNEDGTITNEYNINTEYLNQLYDTKGTAATIGETKQDRLIEGPGITIKNNVISSTGGGGTSENAVTIDTEQTITGLKTFENDNNRGGMLRLKYTGETVNPPVGYLGMNSNLYGGQIHIGVDYSSTNGGNELWIGSNIASGSETTPKKGIRFKSNANGLTDCHLVMGDINYASSISFMNGSGHIVLYPHGGGQLDISGSSLVYTNSSGSSTDLLNQAETTPIATVNRAGKVKPDGTTIAVDTDGTISGNYPTYTEEQWNTLSDTQKSAIKLALILE